jgi:hypothetical protein
MNKPSLWKYAGLGTQFLVGIALALYAGLRVDEFFHWHSPVAVWVLPLLLIVGVMIKIIADTNTKK